MSQHTCSQLHRGPSLSQLIHKATIQGNCRENNAKMDEKGDSSDLIPGKGADDVITLVSKPEDQVQNLTPTKDPFRTPLPQSLLSPSALLTPFILTCSQSLVDAGAEMVEVEDVEPAQEEDLRVETLKPPVEDSTITLYYRPTTEGP